MPSISRPSMPSMPSMPSKKAVVARLPSLPSMPSLSLFGNSSSASGSNSDKNGSDNEQPPNNKVKEKTTRYQSMRNIPTKTKNAINRMNPLKKKAKKEEPEPICIEVVDILRDIGNLDLMSDDESTMEDEAMIMEKNKNNPWFNEDIASVVKLCRKYRRKHHKSKTKKQELKKICKELEKKKRKLIRAAKQK